MDDSRHAILHAAIAMLCCQPSHDTLGTEAANMQAKAVQLTRQASSHARTSCKDHEAMGPDMLWPSLWGCVCLTWQ
jgi:hypothetical protein